MGWGVGRARIRGFVGVCWGFGGVKRFCGFAWALLDSPKSPKFAEFEANLCGKARTLPHPTKKHSLRVSFRRAFCPAATAKPRQDSRRWAEIRSAQTPKFQAKRFAPFAKHAPQNTPPPANLKCKNPSNFKSLVARKQRKLRHRETPRKTSPLLKKPSQKAAAAKAKKAAAPPRFAPHERFKPSRAQKSAALGFARRPPALSESCTQRSTRRALRIWRILRASNPAHCAAN